MAMISGSQSLLQGGRRTRTTVDLTYPNTSVYDPDNTLLRSWNGGSNHFASSPTTTAYESLVPQKRSASSMPHFGLESHSKRAAPVFPSRNPDSARSLRHTSSPTRPLTKSSTGPINIPRSSHRSSRRRSASSTTQTARSFQPNTLNDIHETRIQDMSPTDYLARSSGSSAQHTPLQMSLVTLDHSSSDEWYTADTAALTLFNRGRDESCSPTTTTSDSYLTPVSAVASTPMTRCSTNDQICEPFGMFHMDSATGLRPSESLPEGMQFPTVVSSFSHFPLSEMPVAMKPSLSEASSAESISSSISSVSDSNASTAQARPRTLAPKRNNVSSQAALPKLVAVTSADGTVKHKAEISRAARPPQQRKTTFCVFCSDQPGGFHGDHELRRHIERQHTQYRRVWVCRDISESGTFLRNCKACRNNKSYGANYNAAAHLRRTHFNPCKNKRGGGAKKSENRGGMGGGNSPSMDELKKWMYETYEHNINGRVIVQTVAHDGDVPQIPMLELAAYDQSIPLADPLDCGYNGDSMMNLSNNYASSYSDDNSNSQHHLMVTDYPSQSLPSSLPYSDFADMPIPMSMSVAAVYQTSLPQWQYR